MPSQRLKLGFRAFPCLKAETRVTGQQLRMDAAENMSLSFTKIVAALVGMISAFTATFIGVIAIPFAGYGSGLASVAIHYLEISLGLEFPLYMVLIFISRKVLAYSCLALCIVNYVGAYLLSLSDESGAIRAAYAVKMLIVSVLFPGEISCIAAAGMALYLYKCERPAK